ncbi:hypothetical protein [Paenibacillus mucilaginosus]|nr:hypothetical protein [Paenibacillus mucilaginosus]MCG7212911.1 hypothetical protein [Paenibacillus mucilaginosus]
MQKKVGSAPRSAPVDMRRPPYGVFHGWGPKYGYPHYGYPKFGPWGGVPLVLPLSIPAPVPYYPYPPYPYGPYPYY